MPLALFDLDNTLIDRQSPMRVVAEEFCAAQGLHPADAPGIADVLRDRANPETFASLRRDLRIPSSAPTLWDWYVAAISAAVTCPPETLVGLDQLRATGWSVGIVTNGAVDIQRAKLRATGLDSRVDAVCISDDIGVRKPDPDIFHAAALRCGHSLTDGWMIGDNPANDIVGAQGVGLRTIWIAVGRAWTHDAPPAEHTVDDALAAITHLLTL